VNRPVAGRSFDLAVVGAGLVGLASVHRLLERAPGLRLVVLEKEGGPAVHQSGHNSGVVHAGLYYVPESLKARLCREGASMLRERCHEWGVPLIDRGKLVVAVAESEFPRLDELERRGRANGIEGLSVLAEEELRTIEPHVRGLRALHVPETGVVDFRLVAAKLKEELQGRGVEFRFGSAVTRIEAGEGGIRLGTSEGDIVAGGLVACAGLQADRVAALAGANPLVRIVPFRGGYWALRGKAQDLVRGLIYPVPDPTFPFLGVHFTRGADDRVTAGPNAVPALARESYRRGAFSVRDAADAVAWPGFLRLARQYARTGAREIWRDAVKAAALGEMRQYLPSLASGDIARAGCGIRAQAMTRDGKLVDDFVIEDGPASLHVLNAPSPAATSCLAIGGVVAERAALRFGI
jgi:2-hydroxyglutarate dehydrogenase/L-2-hydroxyglutarate oxidase